MTNEIDAATLAKHATRDRAISVELTYGTLYAKPVDGEAGKAEVVTVGTGGGFVDRETFDRVGLTNTIDRATTDETDYAIGSPETVWPGRLV